MKVRFLAEISKEKEIEIVDPVTGGANKKTKMSKHVSIKAINPATTWQIETKQDVEQYLGTLRSRLIDMLEEDTVVNIEF